MSDESRSSTWDGVTCVSCDTRRVRVPPNPDAITHMEDWMGGKPAYCQECYDEMPDELTDEDYDRSDGHA